MSDFEQQLLIQPTAVELRLRLGFVPERNHAQVMVEVVEPATKVLLAQWSRPHFDIADTEQAVEEAVQRLQEYQQTYVNPF